jgi:P pilus assembly chaperone PapD
MRGTIALSILILSLAQTAYAGVVIGGTRVIYPGDKNEVSLSVRNADSNVDYLIQSWVDNEDENNIVKPPFTITPPLFRLNGDEENLLRIVNTPEKGDHKPPQDRETLYWVSVKSISGSAEGKKENQLKLSVRNRIKLIYRPKSLSKSDAAKAYKSLKFTRHKNSWVVENPTPYYVSFKSLKIGGKELAKEVAMVAPFKEKSINVPGQGPIEWQAINDYGGYSEMAHQ